MTEKETIEGAARADGWQNDEILARLRALLAEHSQAEIARRAGTSRNNVNRYVRGGKVPAEFCAALTANLGVNPAWLLMGEGTRYLADVTSSVGEMATDLLSLVQAMQSVTKLKIGALADKEYAKGLRQLNEALEGYENLRKKLNTYSRTQFEQLVKDMDAAMTKNDFSRAQQIRKAAEQVGRLCDDTKLHAAFDSLLGVLEMHAGDMHEAIRFNRRAFLRRLFERETLTESDLVLATNYTRALAGVFQTREAQQVCRAAVHLAANLRHTWMYWRLVMNDGLADVSLGHIRRGLPKITRAYGRMSGEMKEQDRCQVITCQMFHGSLLPGDALDLVAHPSDSQKRRMATFYVANIVAHLPGIEADRELAMRACRMALEWQYAHTMDELAHTWNHTFLRTLEGHGKKAVDRFIDEQVGSLASQGPFHAFRVRPAGTALLRLNDEADRAREELMRSERDRAHIPVEQTPSFLGYAVHYANALELLEPDTTSTPERRLRRRAERFFHKMHARGYGCFTSFTRNAAKDTISESN